MSEVVEQSAEVTTEQAPETQAPAASEAPAQTEVAPETAVVEGEEKPAYTPSFKYKVYGEEKELPEFIRGVIKSQEDEKKVKELFELSEAVPSYKKKLEDAHSKYSTFETTVKEKLIPEIQTYHQLSESLRSSVEKQDFQGICESLGINPDAMLAIAAKEATLRQNPEQYKLAQAERERMRASQTAEMQISSKEKHAIELESRYIDRMLGMVFERDDVKQYVSAFDTRMGKPGAFEQEVRQRGDYLYQRGEKADPVEIVQYLMKTFPLQAASTQPGNAQAQPPASASNGKPPTIPTVKTGSTSPAGKTRKVPGSIEEMRQAWAKEKNGG
mgnify:CR=1 FL=1